MLYNIEASRHNNSVVSLKPSPMHAQSHMLQHKNMEKAISVVSKLQRPSISSRDRSSTARRWLAADLRGIEITSASKCILRIRAAKIFRICLIHEFLLAGYSLRVRTLLKRRHLIQIGYAKWSRPSQTKISLCGATKTAKCYPSIQSLA